MPEGLEAEIWRSAAEPLVGRRIDRVEFDARVADPRLVDFEGEWIQGIRRHGKVLIVDTSGSAIGLRFGMTGRLVIDGAAAIDRLEYASGADRPDWDRIRVWTSPVPGPAAVAMRMNDPRRLGRIEVDPDLSLLGPDVLGISIDELDEALGGRRTGLKAALMNQQVVAGLGNLCVDEVLFAAGLAPNAAVASLSADDVRGLHRAMRDRLGVMLRRGGSTQGVLDPARRSRLGRCPARGCQGYLRSEKIGGRTTVWCNTHQVGGGAGGTRSPASRGVVPNASARVAD